MISLSAAAATLSIKVTDSTTNEPLEFAAIALKHGDKNIGGLTDTEGIYSTSVSSGKWNISISSVGYTPISTEIETTDRDQTLSFKLKPSYTQISEVVVTAREGKGISSSSLIDRKAMEHLQPSSFTDLIELLPGSVSKDPEMGKANLANLRQAGNASADGFDTSSLGTSFVVDGVQINTNANMQVTADTDKTSRLTTGKGVDMRSISTDDIESVEVVRGIASAEYGEVTSGLINIKRKSGASGLQARFKADMQSQLFFMGKGFNMPGKDWTTNVSADYLDSKIDPRNSRENFKRITGSIRSTKKWIGKNINTTWNTSLNYTGTFERDKNDPDLTVNGTIDYFISDNNSFTWDNTISFISPKKKFFQSLVITAGLSYSTEKLHQDKTIASSRLYPMPISTTPGSNYVGYLPMVYNATLDVDGKPFTSIMKLASQFRYDYCNTTNQLKIGAEYNYSKNFGKGQIYDVMRPIVAGNITRPRAFSDIPGMSQLSAYAENTSEFHLGNHFVELQLGIRETQLLNLDNRYYLNNRPYFDPRINAKWTLPQLFVKGYPIGWEIGGGFGWHTKMPVAAYLFPDMRYTDYVQLNYFHNDEEYRTMNVYTFVEDITNYDIRPARNFKWEVRGDITFRNNRLSVTYFREDMKDAFRQAPSIHIYEYRRYDASEYNPDETGHAPVIEELPWQVEHRLASVNHAANSSRVKKEGVEFTFSSCRIPVIRTRATVSGAWFRTTLSNSVGLWYKPNTIVNGVELPFAGFYDDKEGSVYQSFNTNFMFDTDVPRLGLNFSISIQNMWFTSQQTLFKNGIPEYYMGVDGEIIPFTPDLADDPYLSQLIREYSATAFEERRIPVSTTFNIKATKKLWNDRIGIAIYVNRLLSITPDYYLYGTLQRRYTSPYFGMEINLKF
ncbi:MAG: TonB-dependent receptor [Bacteroidales bacterium]|nr:TonB-dependent receptor [Bacteroidales bacterium]